MTDLTVATVYAMCWKEHWSKPRFEESGWAYEVAGLYRRRIEPEFAYSLMSELTPLTIRKWHDGMAASPSEAKKALDVLSSLFTFAERYDLRPVGSNPCGLIRPFRQRKRGRYATPEEIARLGARLEAHRAQYPREVAFVSLLMLVGCRPSVLLRAKRADLVGDILRVKGKTYHETGEMDEVAFPEAAMEIVYALPTREDGLLLGGPYPRPFWEKIRREAKVPDLWLRDSRRTFATTGLSQGVGIGVIGELLNHRSAQTTKVYAKLVTTTRLEAANQVAGFIVSHMKR